MTRKLVVLALAGTAFLAAPAAAEAAQTFGSRLANSPANGSDNCADPATPPCTLVAYINPNTDGDPVTSPAPSSGVIVRFRLRTLAAEAVTLRLATVTNQGGTLLAQAAGTGSTVTTAGTGEIEQFPARLSVQQGQHLALDAASSHMTYNQGGDQFTPVYAPPLSDGQGPRAPIGDPIGELLVQADIEPDADGDGFGDETQDGCPAQRASQGACDNAGPVISGLSVRKRRIRYSSSEPAEVTFRVGRARPGRRVRGRCRRAARRNANRPRCTRYVTLGTLTDAAEAGANSRALPRRLRGRRLRPGRYRLEVIAVDELGNETVTRKRFRIRR